MTNGPLSGGLGSSLKQQLGTLLFDRPRLAWPVMPIWADRRQWVKFHNRDEELIPNPAGRGYDCAWRWTSDLTVGKHFPGVADRLFRAAVREWPISSVSANVVSEQPDVTFIVGHRGRERLPLLLVTLASLLSQTGCTVEVIVVEQSVEPLLPDSLPASVRWVHQAPPVAEMPYSRSWAFNRGVREARGQFVILHDNDVLAPRSYAAEVCRLGVAGFEAMRLQRFVFYLNEPTTTRVVRDGLPATVEGGRVGLDHVRQNCQGHTLAVERSAYLRIGGHDEAFLGWGGEDNEFYDRCRLLRFHPWAYLPFVHLWHAPQAEKVKPSGALAYLDRALSVPRETRARRLAAQTFGATEGPLLEPCN